MGEAENYSALAKRLPYTTHGSERGTTTRNRDSGPTKSLHDTVTFVPSVQVGRATEAADLNEPTAQTQQGWFPKLHSYATVQSHLLSLSAA